MEALGKRLVKRSPPASEDIKSLQELLLSFDEPLAIAVDLVRERLGYEPTFHIKTTGVILDKLHRQGGSILKSMQDLAGMRIVSDCNRHQQDRIVNKLMQLFAEFGPHRLNWLIGARIQAMGIARCMLSSTWTARRWRSRCEQSFNMSGLICLRNSQTGLGEASDTESLPNTGETSWPTSSRTPLA